MGEGYVTNKQESGAVWMLKGLGLLLMMKLNKKDIDDQELEMIKVSLPRADAKVIADYIASL